MQNSSKYVYKHKNGTWYYRRRVPAHIRNFISAVRVKKSLKTTDVTIAALRCHQINEITELEWARIASEGKNERKEITYQLAVKKAQTLNLNYLPNKQLLNDDHFEEVMRRVSFLEENNIHPDSLTAEAVLGFASYPGGPRHKT